jgi:hypothetical protein
MKTRGIIGFSQQSGFSNKRITKAILLAVPKTKVAEVGSRWQYLLRIAVHQEEIACFRFHIFNELLPRGKGTLERNRFVECTLRSAC